MSRVVPDQLSRRHVLGRLLLAPAAALALLDRTTRPALAQDMDITKSTVLLMVEDLGCPYCARFDAEARDSYVNSAEGRLAPLVRRRRGDPAIARLERIVYSPTFVLLVEGREVGRSVGYRGADLFWMEIASLMRKGGLQGAG